MLDAQDVQGVPSQVAQVMVDDVLEAIRPASQLEAEVAIAVVALELVGDAPLVERERNSLLELVKSIQFPTDPE